MSSCRETCVDESMQDRPEKSVGRGLLPAARQPSEEGRRGETPARKGDAGADGGVDDPGVAQKAIPGARRVSPDDWPMALS